MFQIGLNQMVSCFKVLKKDGVGLWSSKLAHRASLRIFCSIAICKLITKLCTPRSMGIQSTLS